VTVLTPEIFTKGFYVLSFDLKPDREADEEHISLLVKEMCALRHALKIHYQNPSHALCMLISQETSRSTTLGTSQ
jgi:hypothetical protein